MNSPTFSHPHELPQLDRLVDGELPETERRELLVRLEREPEGWRRLALSFLEAQCWQETARATGATSVESALDVVVASPTAEKQLSPRTHRRWKPWMSASLAMAASFFVAFALGMLMRGTWTAGDSAAPQQVARTADQAFADALATHQADAAVKAKLDSELRDAELAAVEEASAYNAVADDNATEVWLPVDLASSDEGLDETSTPAVPVRVLESLKRLGHEVQTNRSLWPVDLKNGKRALVPVDEVEIRYVGHEYQ